MQLEQKDSCSFINCWTLYFKTHQLIFCTCQIFIFTFYSVALLVVYIFPYWASWFIYTAAALNFAIVHILIFLLGSRLYGGSTSWAWKIHKAVIQQDCHVMIMSPIMNAVTAGITVPYANIPKYFHCMVKHFYLMWMCTLLVERCRLQEIKGPFFFWYVSAVCVCVCICLCLCVCLRTPGSHGWVLVTPSGSGRRGRSER